LKIHPLTLNTIASKPDATSVARHAVCTLEKQAAIYDNHDWKPFREDFVPCCCSVIAIAIASLTVPSLAQAKRMGSSKSVRPASIGSKAPAQPAPVAPAAAAPRLLHLPHPQPPPLRQLLRPLPQLQRLLPLVAPA
jgi:hypothetical protein